MKNITLKIIKNNMFLDKKSGIYFTDSPNMAERLHGIFLLKICRSRRSQTVGLTKRYGLPLNRRVT